MGILRDLDRIRELCPDTHLTLFSRWEDVIDRLRRGHPLKAQDREDLRMDVDDALGGLMDDDLL